MDHSEFKVRANEVAQYIVEYLRTLPQRNVTADVEPGYLKPLLPSEPPQTSEAWEDIMMDVEKSIMPGITHWQHPQFHAYFPCGNSYPSILGEMISAAFGAVGFSWISCPVFTELEIVMVNWVGKMLGLPDDFIFLPDNKGGGCIQGSASECVLVCLLAARHKKIKELRRIYPKEEEGVLLSKLVAYTSEEAHSCIQKAAMICFVKIRHLETDDKYSLRGETLAEAIKEDKEKGLVPFFVAATLGTTSCCSFDNLEEIGPICQQEDIWLHVDAAYAGNALICPELRYLSRGIEYAHSFNVNLHKWLMVNFDCSLMWVKDRTQLTEPLTVEPLYLQHNQSDKSIDYRSWTIPLSRRFRSLKLWFVLRKHGVCALQDHVREHIRLAKKLESWIKQDSRFQVQNEVRTGLVCFSLKGPNHLTETLLYFLNGSGKFFAVPASLKGTYVIRMCINSQTPRENDVLCSWAIVSSTATSLLQIHTPCSHRRITDQKDKENDCYKMKRPAYMRSFSESRTCRIYPVQRRNNRLLTEIADNDDEPVFPLR